MNSTLTLALSPREREFSIIDLLSAQDTHSTNPPTLHPSAPTHQNSSTARQLSPKPLKTSSVRHHIRQHHLFHADHHPTQSPNQFHDSKNLQYTVQSHAVRKEVRENQSTPCPNNISTPLTFFIYTCSAFTFFAYPSEIRKAIYATKAIKSLKMENTLIDQKA